ncbi:MAG: transposase [Rikenellaceae bacterium]
MRDNTNKRESYFDEVIRLHREYGYGEHRVSRILPIGHSTVSRWVRIFANENQSNSTTMKKNEQPPLTNTLESTSDVKHLQAEVKRLQSQLDYERLRAEAYNEMINVAEVQFKVPIRKKLAPNGLKLAYKEF